MTEIKGLYAQSYMLPPLPRNNSTTGKLVEELRGPYSLCVVGCGWNPLTEAEIVELVKAQWGVAPASITTKKLIDGEFVEVEHPKG